MEMTVRSMNTEYPKLPPNTVKFFKHYFESEAAHVISWEFAREYHKWHALVRFADGTETYAWPDLTSI